MATLNEDLQGCLDKAISVAKGAYQIVQEALKSEKPKGNIKGDSSADLVTETDIAVEKYIISELKRYYPNHEFIGEESSTSGRGLTDTPTWIIDPIDGTSNFVHRFPFSVISIGLTINKEPVVGVAYNVFQNQLYYASKGNGAFLNGQSIKVSNVTDLSKAIVITDYGSTRKEHEFGPKVTMMSSLAGPPGHVHGIRTLGSAVASQCIVGSGGADAYFEYGVHCWDMAAGVVIVREAGGIAIHPTGTPLDLMSRAVLVAANQTIADSIIPLVQHIDYPRD